MRRPGLLPAFVGLLVGLALPVVLVVVVATPYAGLLADPVPVLLLTTLIVVGELRPIMISHGDDTVDIVTLSSCFSLALVLHGPMVLALAAQVAAFVIDDVRCRRGWLKAAFNHANFVLSLMLVRVVYCSLTGRDLLAESSTFRTTDIVPALLAAVAFYLLNQGLTTTVISLAVREPVGANLRRDLRAHLTSMGVLLALAPVVVQAMAFSPWLVLLLLLPIVSVHKSAGLAVERERQALHDPLTGLPNRALFNERAARAARVRGDGLLAVMVIDLDHFKEINDTLGHQVGDRLLVAVAERVRGAVRAEDFVARLGGDEFALVCPDLQDAAEADALAERVVKALEPAFLVDGVRLDVRASLGVALSPDHGLDEQALLQRADIALYAAKEQRGTWARYRPEHDEHSLEKLALLGELRDGMERGELVVHYQPLCSARTGALLSVEALVRWEHPVLGLLSPDRFVPLAENTGLIARLTQLVLDTTLAQVVDWEAAGLRVDVGVNMSARQLTDLELPDRVASGLAAHGLDPRRLVLEVTESHIVADTGRTEAVLRALREVGVGLAVDDFGTGFSSLAQLRGLKVDVLKIDRSFVTGMCTDGDDALIVRSTIELAHNLGLAVVAEGVEDLATLQALDRLDCDVVQGYHLSPPLSGAAMLGWAQSRALALVPVQG